GQGLPVQVARKADQVDLNLAGVLAEGRVGPHIGCPGPYCPRDGDADGIDSVTGDERRESVEVGGGEAERLAATLARGDRAVQPIRPAEEEGGLAHVTMKQGGTDPAAGYGEAIDDEGRHNREREPGQATQLSQGIDVAFAVMAEAEVDTLDNSP